MTDLAEFFDTVRPMFGGSLSRPQVQGMEVLLSGLYGMHVTHRAYCLATAFHETARTMLPISERGPVSYFDRYEPGTRIGDTLGNTEKGDGFRFRGRGYVQITGRRNYGLAKRKTGVDLIANPDAAMNTELAAQIMREGMSDGWFTGRAMEDYLPGDYVAARRVVNGTDRARKIAGYAETFERALRASEDGHGPTVAPPAPPASDVPQPGFWGALAALLQRIFGK